MLIFLLLLSVCHCRLETTSSAAAAASFGFSVWLLTKSTSSLSQCCWHARCPPPAIPIPIPASSSPLTTPLSSPPIRIHKSQAAPRCSWCALCVHCTCQRNLWFCFNLRHSATPPPPPPPPVSPFLETSAGYLSCIYMYIYIHVYLWGFYMYVYFTRVRVHCGRVWPEPGLSIWGAIAFALKIHEKLIFSFGFSSCWDCFLFSFGDCGCCN